MDAAAVIAALTPLVPGAALEAGDSADMPTIHVPAATLVATCRALRDTPALAFDFLADVIGVDYLPREPRYDVVYHLVSLQNRTRLRVKGNVCCDGHWLRLLRTNTRCRRYDGWQFPRQPRVFRRLNRPIRLPLA